MVAPELTLAVRMDSDVKTKSMKDARSNTILSAANEADDSWTVSPSTVFKPELDAIVLGFGEPGSKGSDSVG